MRRNQRGSSRQHAGWLGILGTVLQGEVKGTGLVSSSMLEGSDGDDGVKRCPVVPNNITGSNRPWFRFNIGKTSSLGGQCSTRRGYPEKLCNILSQRFPGHSQIKSWLIWSNIEGNWLQMSLSTAPWLLANAGLFIFFLLQDKKPLLSAADVMALVVNSFVSSTVQAWRNALAA